ncbi:PREDICTED: kxDL motif-containing protein 1 [Tarenaya hassleriana]|uniref:kxDL motif-containing protein 1 n=1 Tax=Tarenaya hassleriana TaxID=28532 RepID=UPI00053C8334|nr:PREDICTED: kxDL motif-containing protein 1 [Tarenaya hassleriana]XP_010528364.1 PREDICTED: kxDL motif-containing protein 1 [Tarenaya hassleriana]XP_010528365.1 PREDICTED: kxDL motif-containing protein 1 [Tarenaya hassleriana]XP_010528366.1 PREDICTED: kxDL motif-containing protein 1 [Tarenaya hassleriana]
MEGEEKESIREASKEWSDEFKTLVKTEDLDSLRHLQHLILGRLQDSNAVLSHYNEFAENCFTDVSLEFSRNTRLLKSMKADLDYIFLKLRSIKAKITETYPDAFPDESTSDAFDRRPNLELPL